MTPTFSSRRQPALILTPTMQRDAFILDRNRAALRCDMREVHRIETEAARATVKHLMREVKRTA